MSTRKFLFVLIFTAASILLSDVSIKSQDAEIDKVVREVSVDSQKGAIFSYTYLMRFSYRRHKPGGRRFTRLYEAILPSKFSSKGTFRHPFVLLEDSENLITEEDIIKARQEVARVLERAESEDVRHEPGSVAEDGGYWTMSFSANGRRIRVDALQLVKSARLSNLERKEVDGRSIVSLEFLPNPDAVFEKSLAYLSRLEGKIWIDEGDQRIIRIEGFAPGILSSAKDKSDQERRSEAVFYFLQTKVAEGFWFPQTVRLNFSRHPELFESVELEFSFSNYKKASVEIKETIDQPNDAESESDID